MTKEDALQWAAQAWCKPETETIAMNPPLANAFADILTERVNQEVQAYRLRSARQVFADAFTADPSFRSVYVDNVACAIRDNADNPNKAADHIVKLLFTNN